MSKELIPTQKQSALAVMASKFSVEPPKLLETLRATLMPKASNEELLAFVVTANQYDLNPFTKEIYAFPGRSGGINPVVSVDGWIKLMNRHPQFDGIQFKTEDRESKPFSVTATIYLKDRSRPVEVTEYFSELQPQHRAVEGQPATDASTQSVDPMRSHCVWILRYQRRRGSRSVRQRQRHAVPPNLPQQAGAEG